MLPAHDQGRRDAAQEMCPDENALAEYLDGLLHDGQTMKEVQGHLAVCPRCRYLVQVLSTDS